MEFKPRDHGCRLNTKSVTRDVKRDSFNKSEVDVVNKVNKDKQNTVSEKRIARFYDRNESIRHGFLRA